MFITSEQPIQCMRYGVQLDRCNAFSLAIECPSKQENGMFDRWRDCTVLLYQCRKWSVKFFRNCVFRCLYEANDIFIIQRIFIINVEMSFGF